MNSKANMAQIAASANQVQGITQTALLVNLAVTFLVLGPLSAILGSVNQLQFLVHIFLINLSYPATATIFFGNLM
jgi:hypothetical protein